ncbi:MAG: 3-hydroxyacyl-CoA dehydrogenase family protein [Proteobacteria bacterium]|nr:3-hydroxyacyl-CoA dehydrogenase family protein [Pseudomonadota bacterium]
MTSPLRIGVLGAGVMGAGIAQTLATSGHRAVCTDVSAEALEQGRREAVEGRFGIESAVGRGRLSREQADAAIARLEFTESFEEAAASDLVVECVPEKLDLKMQVFRELDRAAPEHAILASNSSGLPITALAQATGRPARVIGWHWASPAPVMRLAEIVVTPETDPEVRQAVCELAAGCGKNPIVVNDNPMAWGYVANRVYSAMIREANRVIKEGVATQEDVNQLMVDCFRWPTGPFGMVKGASGGWKK